MPNLAGIINSVSKIGVRGSTFGISINGKEAYVSIGIPPEKRKKFEECMRLRGERVVLVYEKVHIEFCSTDRIANFLSGLFSYGKRPVNYREVREIILERDYLTAPMQDIFD